MAVRVKTILYTFSSATPVSFATIINSPGDSYIGSITLRAGVTNAGNVTWTDDIGGTAGGFLDAGEAVSFDLIGKYVYAGHILLTGETNDTVYITVLD